MDEPQQPMNPTPSPTPENVTPMIETPKRQYGPLIGIIIIVALLGLGGLYFWGMQMMQSDTEMENVEMMQEESDPITDDLRMQSDSDEVDSIEADLEATSFDDLDSGSENFEGELQVQ